MTNQITCPQCGTKIPLEEALIKQVEDNFRLSHEAEFAKEKEQLIKTATQKAQAETEQKLKLLEEENREKSEKLAKANKQELELRKQFNKLEEDKRSFELEKQRQLDQERQQIREQAQKQILEEQKITDLAKDKLISDLKKSLEDARRKADQGSQQTQGEVIELQLEEMLKNSFPTDEIVPISKGVNGADVRQIVKSSGGTTCGTVLWESKQTKSFKNEWLQKLKNDLRTSKDDIAALVSAATPEPNWKGISHIDGVWVCSYDMVLPLSMLLRKALLDVGYQKAISKHQGKKADILYEYITGSEFRGQIESMVEVFMEMNAQITKERVVFEKSWKQREGQLQRLFTSTVNIFGGIQGRVGSNTLPEIKGLELLSEGEI